MIRLMVRYNHPKIYLQGFLLYLFYFGTRKTSYGQLKIIIKAKAANLEKGLSNNMITLRCRYPNIYLWSHAVSPYTNYSLVFVKSLTKIIRSNSA